MSENEIKNNNIKVKVSKEPNCKVTLKVTAFKDFVKDQYKEAVTQVGRNVAFPEDVKDKNKEKFILDNYKDQVENQCRELIIISVFREALPLTNMYPFRNDNAKCSKIDDLVLGKECKLTIEFEVNPEVPLINLDKIVLKNVKRRPITKNDIDLSIENIRVNYATWSDVPDRQVQDGDYVDLDITGALPPYPEICRQTRFCVEQGKIPGWIYKSLIGKKVNEKIEATSEPDPQQVQAEIPFQAIKCNMIVRAIKRAVLPEIDDNLARRVGARSLSDLKERLTADLNHRADIEVSEKLRQQVDQSLLENYDFELPMTLIREEKQARILNLVNVLKRQNVSQEIINKSVQELEKSLDKNVSQDYRIFFLMNSFARQHNIVVSRDEIAQELTQQVMQNLSSPFVGLSNQEVEAKLGMQLLLRKCHDFIVEHVGRH